jgi:GT2 family glycosyltransferase
MLGSGPRADLTVSVVVIGTDGRRGLARAVASVLAQEHRPLELVLFGNGGPLSPPVDRGDVAVRSGHSPENLGVAGGRNAAARLAGGDVLVFLDDDAVLAAGALSAAVDVLARDPAVGAVAFNVVDPETGRAAMWYHPYDPAEWMRRPFEAMTVIGCGHAVRRECFDALGGFWEGYFREMEEVDFSWRLLDAGRVIRYEPAARVEHPERTARHLRHSVRSNLLMAWRLLPLPLALRQIAVKALIFAYRGARHGELGDCVRGFAEALRRAPGAGRRALAPETVAYLRRVHAPQGPGKRLQWSLRPVAAPPPFGAQPGAASASWPAATPITPPHSATR